MNPIRVAVLCCALVLSLAGAASADEVDATLACHHRCCKRCYNPCEPTGPVRRFLRRVFLPPCPPPCPAPAGVVFVPPPPAPCPPSANLGRPVAPPAPDVAPVPAPFPSATSNRPQRLTPPTPPTPVRLDRLASRNGE